ncbi:MAG: biotin carboxylase, partial [Pseudomonadota bacterium]
AEDADAGFIPATGRVLALEPPEGPGIRFDGGVVEGQEVTAAFDPMLAKLIVHGASRDQAVQRMRAALAQTVLLGVTTNIAFLDRVLRHAGFAEGDVDTDALDRWSGDLALPEPDPAELAVVLAAAGLNHRGFRDRTRPLPQPYAGIGAWRN